MIEYALLVAGVAAIAAAVFSNDVDTDGTVGKAIKDKVTTAVSG
jgi:Flp pilus assembly pilin Flp